MKRRFPFFIMLLLTSPLVAQPTLTDKQKRQAAEVALQLVADFGRNLSSRIGQPAADLDPTDRLELDRQLSAMLRPDARLLNDLTPERTGSPTLDFAEYVKRANLIDFPDGLSYNLDFKTASFGNTVQATPGGHLLMLYLTKEMEGQYKRLKPFARRTPCRVGVYFELRQNKIGNGRIGLIDEQLPSVGQTFILHTETDHIPITIDDVLRQLTRQLTARLPTLKTRQVRLDPFGFGETGIINEFAQLLTASLRTQLKQANPDLQIQLPTRTWQQDVPSIGSYYLARHDSVLFSTQLTDQKGFAIGDPIVVGLPIGNLAGQLWQPDTAAVQVANTVQEVLTPAKPLPNPQQLRFALRTDRGTSNVLYLANDTLRVFVKTEQPCHLRLIYRDAESHLLLLEDSAPISTTQVGRWQAVGGDKTFVVSGPPFGSEHLIAYVSDTPFAPLRTHKLPLSTNAQGREEYITLIDDDLSTVKKTSISSSGTNGSVVEQVVKMTTRKR
jgi:hypothetical protein